MEYLIGIDIGTTNIKVILFDETGRQISAAQEKSPLQLLKNNGGIFDAEKVWNICAGLLKDLLDKCAFCGKGDVASKIAGLAVSGMGEAGVPMDAEGNSLYPVIAWFDARTESYPSWWDETFGEKRLFEITNLKSQHIFTVNKLLWLKEHEKECFSKIKRWDCMPDYIAYRLTGRSVMDYTIATRTMMLDVHQKCWSEEILNHCGISKDILPELVPSGSLIGRITKEAFHKCGLLPGTPVYAGGHDHICGALAAGVISPHVLLDSSGTCEEVLVSMDSIAATEMLSRKGFNAGFHVAQGRTYISGGIPASGASVDWFLREFPCPDTASAHVAPSIDGPLFLPHLRGGSSPQRDKSSMGAFVGLRAQHQWSDLMQAVYEGVAFELKLSAEQLLGTTPPSRMITIGGGSKNDIWLQIKADVMNTVIEVPEVQESTALGAALLAGIGVGIYRDADDAVAKTFRVGKRILPCAETQKIYQKKWPIYRRLYTALHEVNEMMDAQ